MAKKKRDEDDLDYGKGPDLDKEDMEGAIFEDEPEEEEENAGSEEVEERIREYVANTDMNRIVENDEEIRFLGSVRVKDIPKCACCGAAWAIREGAMASPGCGCIIHPVCNRCNRCEAHCTGHYRN